MSSIHAARSRASISWIGASGGPGASVSPPSASRRSHHGRRPMFSCGPTITPGAGDQHAAGHRRLGGALARRLHRPVLALGGVEHRRRPRRPARRASPRRPSTRRRSRSGRRGRPARPRSARRARARSRRCRPPRPIRGPRSAERSLVRSPISVSASGCARPCRPRWKTVTACPRASAVSTTWRPRNTVPPMTSSLTPRSARCPARRRTQARARRRRPSASARRAAPARRGRSPAGSRRAPRPRAAPRAARPR